MVPGAGVGWRSCAEIELGSAGLSKHQVDDKDHTETHWVDRASTAVMVIRTMPLMAHCVNPDSTKCWMLIKVLHGAMIVN